MFIPTVTYTLSKMSGIKKSITKRKAVATNESLSVSEDSTEVEEEISKNGRPRRSKKVPDYRTVRRIDASASDVPTKKVKTSGTQVKKPAAKRLSGANQTSTTPVEKPKSAKKSPPAQQHQLSKSPTPGEQPQAAVPNGHDQQAAVVPTPPNCHDQQAAVVPTPPNGHDQRTAVVPTRPNDNDQQTTVSASTSKGNNQHQQDSTDGTMMEADVTYLTSLVSLPQDKDVTITIDDVKYNYRNIANLGNNGMYQTFKCIFHSFKEMYLFYLILLLLHLFRM